MPGAVRAHGRLLRRGVGYNAEVFTDFQPPPGKAGGYDWSQPARRSSYNGSRPDDDWSCAEDSLVARFWLALSIAAPALAADQPVDFDRDVRPILSDRCFACHGPDEKRRMAALRLDTQEGLFAHRGDHDIVFAGDPGRSRLLARVSAATASRMPPAQTGPGLTEPQIATIRKWIEQGAK